MGYPETVRLGYTTSGHRILNVTSMPLPAFALSNLPSTSDQPFPNASKPVPGLNAMLSCFMPVPPSKVLETEKKFVRKVTASGEMPKPSPSAPM